MHIEVEDSTVTNDKTRNGNIIRNQKICVWGHDKYPVQVNISLNGDSPAYAPGLYQFNASCFVRSRFGGLEMDGYNISLEPLNDAQVKALA